MPESKASEEARGAGSAPSSGEEIRVTDRRRFNLDAESSDKEPNESAAQTTID